MARRTRSWKPAETYKLVQLPPNGPKPGQSTDQWLYGKQKAAERLVDDPRTSFNDLP
jgi:hypothetical protein